METTCGNLLEKRIVAEFEALGKLNPGTAQHDQAVDSLVKLYKLKLDEDKSEQDEKLESRRIENEEINHEHNRCDEAEKEKSHRTMQIIGYAVQGVSILAPLVMYGKLYYDGLRFEQTGAVTSSFFRNLIGKFRPSGK